MSLPIVGQKNATQIGVLIEYDTKQIVSFPFVPIRCAPDAGYSRHMCVIVVKQDLEPHAMKLRSGKQVIIYFEAGLFFRSAIKPAHVREKIHFQPGLTFQKSTGCDDVFARNDDGDFAESFRYIGDPFRMLTL